MQTNIEKAKEILSTDGNQLENCSKDLKNNIELISIALRQNPKSFKFVPKEIRNNIDYDYLRNYALEDSSNLQYIDNPTINELKYVLKKDGHQLKHINKYKHINENEMIELIETSLSHSPFAIKHANIINKRILYFAMRQNQHVLELFSKSKYEDLLKIFNNSKEELYEFYKESILLNGRTLEYIPKEILTEELQLLAVSSFGSSIKHIEKPTHEMLVNAIKNNFHSLEHISEELQTEELFNIYFQEISKYKTPSKIIEEDPNNFFTYIKNSDLKNKIELKMKVIQQILKKHSLNPNEFFILIHELNFEKLNIIENNLNNIKLELTLEREYYRGENGGCIYFDPKRTEITTIVFEGIKENNNIILNKTYLKENITQKNKNNNNIKK
jgi:hypothetical protein